MRKFALALVLFTVAASASRLDAQVMASEKGTVSQTIDGTTTSLTYSRPRARGRPWEMVLDKDTFMFHTNGPKQRPGQIRFPVKREKRPFLEVLTWWFPEVSTGGATLAMQWDTVYVPLRLGVTPSYTTAVAPDVAKRIAGVYDLQFEPFPEPPRDSTVVADLEKMPTRIKLTIRQQGTELRAVMDPPLSKIEEGYTDWIILPSKPGWFTMGRIWNGEITDIADYWQIQFDAAGDRAKSFEIRAPNDMLVGKGTRVSNPPR